MGGSLPPAADRAAPALGGRERRSSVVDGGRDSNARLVPRHPSCADAGRCAPARARGGALARNPVWESAPTMKRACRQTPYSLPGMDRRAGARSPGLQPLVRPIPLRIPQRDGARRHCSFSSIPAASGRSNRCTTTAPLRRSRSLTLRSCSSFRSSRSIGVWQAAPSRFRAVRTANTPYAAGSGCFWARLVAETGDQRGSRRASRRRRGARPGGCCLGRRRRRRCESSEHEGGRRDRRRRGGHSALRPRDPARARGADDQADRRRLAAEQAPVHTARRAAAQRAGALALTPI